MIKISYFTNQIVYSSTTIVDFLSEDSRHPIVEVSLGSPGYLLADDGCLEVQVAKFDGYEIAEQIAAYFGVDHSEVSVRFCYSS